jgi:hypothetical protein
VTALGKLIQSLFWQDVDGSKKMPQKKGPKGPDQVF